MKSYLKSLARDVRYSIRARRALKEWHAAGCPVPPPPGYKQHLVRDCARQHSLQTLIETGTLYGDMVYAVRRHFRKIVSIELSSELATKARYRLRGISNISVLEGDSTAVLPSVLGQLRGPALFWLDAHFAGPGTARGEVDTPVVGELNLILPSWIVGSAILIDDARYFNGQNGYPTLPELIDFARVIRPATEVVVGHDIIRLN